MADLQEILSSISDEDMKKLQGVAQSLLASNQNTQSQSEKNEPAKTKNAAQMPFDTETVNKVMSVMGKMNFQDNRTRLINDLKPLLNSERQKKADDAIRFLQLMEVLPTVKELFFK